MKITFKHLALVGFILARWQLNAQAVIVYEDLFSNNCEGSTSGILPTCQNGTSPNNNKWGYVDQDAGTGVSWKFTGGEGYLQNQFGVNYDYGYNLIYKGGDGYYSGDRVYETDADFICRFTNNTQNLEWTFNFKGSKTPWGLTNGAQTDAFGGAFVIGMDSPTIRSCTYSTIGYAVVFGDASGAGNNVKLVRINGGGSYSPCETNTQGAYTFFNWNGTNSTTCLLSDNEAITSSWYSVKVQYNPSNDEWRLFVRNDGASKGDPQTLNSTHGKGAKVDNTYTGSNLRIMGFYGCFSDGNSLKSIKFDNLRIKRNVTLISTPAGSGTCAGIAALPVRLGDISITCNEYGVNLNWTTASETNNESYKIERSEDGSIFYSIGNLPASGNVNIKTDYFFDDINPIRGIVYYKVSQIDIDGNQTELGTLSTEWPCKDQSDGIQIFPNPTEGDVNLLITRNDRDDYFVHVSNSVGQMVIPSIEVEGKENGITQLRLRTSELPSGVYLIKVILGDKVFTKKLLIEE